MWKPAPNSYSHNELEYRGYILKRSSDPYHGSCYKLYGPNGSYIKTYAFIDQGSRTEAKEYVDLILKENA